MVPSRGHAESGVGVDQLLSSNEAWRKRPKQAERRQRAQRPKQGFFRTLLQVIGEFRITVGALLLLFVVWQLWWTNIAAASAQQQVVADDARELQGPTIRPTPEFPTGFAPRVTMSGSMAAGTVFGIAYIPRFGDTFSGPLVEGVAPEQLDTLGLGSYDTPTLRGGVGNFTVACHRQTHGSVLDAIHTLVPGDKIYIRTKDGYYTCVLCNNQIVMRNRADVLLPVPTQPDAAPTERFLTISSCNPRFGAEERIIAYSVLDSGQPASAGPSAAIAARVAANQKG